MARAIAHIILCLVTVPLLVCADGRQTSSETSHPASSTGQLRRVTLDRIINARLSYYARHFTKMDFVVLDGSGNAERNMGLLFSILGNDPEPLDYEHPRSLRNTLLELTYARIRLLLEADVGSATLFAPGEDARASREQVCVITISPWIIAKDNLSATQDLLEIPEQEFSEVPPSEFLDADSHLRFTIDHEIYHCLDASINGPVPMSKQPYWAGYYMMRNEAGADAFGIIMNMAESGTVTPYARSLRLIRGLTLLNNDPNHDTSPAIDAVLKLNPAKLAKTDIIGRFRLASQIRGNIVGNYQDYVRYAAAAELAMKRLGIDREKTEFAAIPVDETQVEKLLRQVRENYLELLGHKLLPAN